ncbi:MAG: hypothetical protein PHE18_03690 [Candidatus Omnitrophica bacterium]|nr:hypothetical protein [Candidatus Omnitrophota bacterium]MDD5552960.1 hypothetical protein [Candidatus Omnitrophota bacterium]
MKPKPYDYYNIDVLAGLTSRPHGNRPDRLTVSAGLLGADVLLPRQPGRRAKRCDQHTVTR